MVFSLLLGTIVGFVLAVPPGPVGVTTLKAGLRGDERGGVLIGLGAGVMDLFYCLFAMLAACAFFFIGSVFWGLSSCDGYLSSAVCTYACGLWHNGAALLSCTTMLTARFTPGRLRIIAERLKKEWSVFYRYSNSSYEHSQSTFLPSLAYTSMVIQHSSFFENTALNCLLFSVGFGFGNFRWLLFHS